MTRTTEHSHDTEELFHESEPLALEINEIQSRLSSLEENSEPATTGDSRFQPNRKAIDKLTDTVNNLVKIVGFLAERDGFEVITEDNTTIIMEAS